MRHRLLGVMAGLLEASIKPFRVAIFGGRHPSAPTDDSPDERIVASILHDFDEHDERAVRDLQASGRLPDITVLIFADAPWLSRLDEVLQSVLAQPLKCRQILIATAKRHSRSIGRLLKKMKCQATIIDDAESLNKIEETNALLILSGSVSLRYGALAVFACELKDNKALIYSDEVSFAPPDAAKRLFLKPAYSPRLASASNYMGSCAAINISPGQTVRTIVNILEEMQSATTVPQLLTHLASRCAPDKVKRSPFVTFEEHDRARMSLPRIKRSRTPVCQETVSIIIPTKDRLDLLKPCLDSLFETTSYPKHLFDVIIVDNGSSEQATLAFLEQGHQSHLFKVVSDADRFNYSRLCNKGVAASHANVLLFLNNDTLICQSDWLHRLAARAIEEGIGAVGAKLLYDDFSIQHAGIVLAVKGGAAHINRYAPRDDPGHYGLGYHSREMSAVTGACVAIQRDRFLRVGGYDENLAVAFNDILLCTSLEESGLTNFFENEVEVIHLESKSRGLVDTPERQAKFEDECRYARSKTPRQFLEDKYYNPSLGLVDIYQPTDETRRIKPWFDPRHQVSP